MPKGGARKGAGRKPKPLIEKVKEATKPSQRSIGRPKNVKIPAPSRYMELTIKYEDIIPSPAELYIEKMKFLYEMYDLYELHGNKDGYDYKGYDYKIIPAFLVEMYALADYYSLLMHYEMVDTEPLPEDGETRAKHMIKYADLIHEMTLHKHELWKTIQRTIDWFVERQNPLPVILENEPSSTSVHTEGDGWDEYWAWRRMNPWLDEV